MDALRPPGRLRPARAGKLGKRALAPEWSFFTTVSSQKCIFGRFAAFWPPPPHPRSIGFLPLFCHTNHEAPGRRIPLLEARCHLKPYSSVQFSPVQSSCSIRTWSREHQGAARSNRGHWGAQKCFILPHQTHLAPKNALFCHTKHNSKPKMPYF